MTEEYRYRCKSTGKSSDKYGNCEVCHKPCSDVYYQTEERKFGEANEDFWTHNKCFDYFGHEECLINRRR